LDRQEIAVLVETDPQLWSNLAKRIDPRLQNGPATFEREGPNARYRLTEQQRRVLDGICEGLRNKEVAAQIGLSEGAVKATLQQLFRKTSARTRVQLVRIALEGSFGTSR
jgi:DNA-binding NarL/FixJ family response regulator